MRISNAGDASSRGGKSNLIAIIVAALGYFVDVYDIWLFANVRKPSLLGIGVPEALVKPLGEALLNYQMAGFVLGSILFGVIADKKGRLAVLFSSILLYSVANIANGFAWDFWSYAACRIVAGIGLAGELGAGIALVSELVSTSKRGWATTFVATVGVAGSVAAPLMVKWVNNWQISYWIGGGLGLLLLIARIGVFESGMFEKLKTRDDVERGNFWALFRSGERFSRYLATILCGLPVWYFAGLIMTFSDVVQKNLGISSPKSVPDVLMIAALGLCLGDILFGGISQLLRSRKRAFLIAYALMTLMLMLIFNVVKDADAFYWCMFIAGIGAGFWAVFVTTAGEVFGTNLRGTVSTTAPSMVRGLVIPLVLVLQPLEASLGYVPALQVLWFGVLALAVWAVIRLPETFSRDMNFLEN